MSIDIPDKWAFSLKVFYNLTISVVFCFLCSSHIYAQTRETIPFGMNSMLFNTLQHVSMRSIDSSMIKHLKQEYEKDQSIVGYNFKTSFTPDNSGKWNSFSKTYNTWILKLKTSGAYGISLVLADINLKAGEKLFIYNLHGVHGPFEKGNLPSSGILPLNYLEGDEIVIEFNTLRHLKKRGSFVIETVSHGFVNIFEKDAPISSSNQKVNQSKSCYTCLDGDFWQKNKRSVVKMVIFQENTTIMCTGTLINNTAQDEKPYILSAQHCISSQSEADRAVFTFDYDDSNCDGLTKSTNKTFLGAQYRASLYENDFSLVELYYRVPLGFNPYFAGWDISDRFIDRVSCIHHPLGGVKKISVRNDYVDQSDYVESIKPPRSENAFWHVEKWDVGITEGGSSGGPLFNKNQHVIGTLTGGSSRCEYPYHDYFARLSQSWEPSDDVDRQLKHWLDPLSSGVTVLNGRDPFEGINASCDTISNLRSGELTDLIPYLPGTGYFAGCNSDNIKSYAEKFQIDDSALLTGVTLFIGSINSEAKGGVLIAVNSVVNGLPGQAIYEQYISYSKLHLFFNYLEFYPYVKVKDEFFISYTLSCLEGDPFSLEQVQWRKSPVNTAFMKFPAGWIPMNQVNAEGMGSSLYIDPVLCTETVTDTTTQTSLVELYPNPVLSELIVKLSPEIEIFRMLLYNTTGSLQDVNYNTFGNDLIINTTQLAPGMYVIHIVTTEKIYPVKFIKL